MTTDKANESPSDATNPIENKNDDDGIDIDDDTKNTTNERHSEPQKEQRDLQSGLAITTKKKRKKKKETNTTQRALPKPLHTIAKRSILERIMEVEDKLI